MEKQQKVKMKDLPAKGKKGGNWHFRSGKKKEKFRKFR